MTHFPVPTVNDTQDFFEITRWVNNTATGGLFMPMMLLTIWVIAFIGSIAEGRPAYRAWIFASFIGSILSILLGLMGLLDPRYIYLNVLFVGIGLFWAHLQRARTI